MKKVYKFSATGCQPCKTLTQHLAMKGYTLPEFDIDKPDNKALMERFNIRSVPTVVIEEADGSYLSFVGAMVTEELLKAVV